MKKALAGAAMLVGSQAKPVLCSGLLIALFALAANSSIAGTIISVNFQGRSGSGTNAPTTALAPADVAGYVAAANWNNIDNYYGSNVPGFQSADNGTTGALADSTGAATSVTMDFAGNDSWNNDTDPSSITTPDARMMNGIIKANCSSPPCSESFTFHNLPGGTYDVYVYMNENGDNTQLNIDDQRTTFYVTETHQFYDTSYYIQAKNTVDPDTAGGTRDLGNFVKFTGDSGSIITITATHTANNDGCGIAGIQIVSPSGNVTFPPATISVSQQPQSFTAVEGVSTNLSIKASTTGRAAYGIFYQWTKNGTNLVGATSATLPLNNLTVADSGSKYTVVVSAPGATNVTSDTATLTVVPDTLPPQVIGASAFPSSTKVGLTFNKPLDPTSAAMAANYKVNGAAIVSAMVRTNVANELTHESNLVQLTLSAPLTNDFTVTLSGIKDLKGNSMAATTANGKVLNLTVTDIGSSASQPGGPDPLFPSTVTTWGPGAFDVFCNGNDYWNNADGFNFVWAPKTNSFDVKVRVVSVAPIDNWSAGAIEVREGPPTPNGGGWELARHYFVKTDYGGPDPSLHGTGSGANSYEFNGRLAPGDPTLRETSNNAPGGSVGWGGTGPGNPGAPPYPNAWIRIARVKGGTNDHLIAYTSGDGVSWSQRMDVDLNDSGHAGFLNLAGNPAGPWPDVCYVGLGSTSHTGVGNTPQTNDGTIGATWYSPVGQPFGAYIIYRDYGDFANTSTSPELGFAVNADGSVTLTYTGNLYSSDTVNGKFTAVSGATSPFKVTPKTSGKKATFYISGP